MEVAGIQLTVKRLKSAYSFSEDSWYLESNAE